MKSFFTKYLHNSITLCILLAITLNFTIESISRRSIHNGIDYLLDSPMTFFYNAFIIFATLSVAFLVKRRIFVYVVVSIFWLATGITNGIILGFRTTPFTVTDLSLLESGISIIPNYLSTNQMILAGSITVALIIALVLVFIFMPKHKEKVSFKRSIAGLLIIIISLAGVTKIAIERDWVSTFFGNLNYAYRDYGFPYCFINTWLNTGIDATKDYSEDKMLSIFPEEMLNQEQGLIPVWNPENTNTKEMPNIIMLQLESFFDPTLVKGLTFSQDPVPNFRRLKEERSSGFLTVPSIGAGTANTEFEILSGMSVRFFGPGEYPYKSVLKKTTTETIAYNLKQLGYSAHAIHNHRGAFYGRNDVFAHLGFDTFTSMEYMNNVIKTPRNWAKDGVLTGEILTALESTEEQDFIYTISVQGHGQYPGKKVYKEPQVTCAGIETKAQSNAFEYYVQQIYEMDAFVGELVEALEALEEETVLVLFGDHLPSLDLAPHKLVNGSVYETEYVIWSSFPMEKEDKNLHAYQLSAEVLDRLDIHQGVMTKYHQNFREDPQYLSNLKALQYDMLYGKNYIYGGRNPFLPTKLKMGVKDIRVDEVLKIGEKYYIKGQNFTPFSKISINEKVLDTIFLGPSILGLLEDVDPKNVSEMKVSQVEKNKEILSTTE
ncbi:MAG: LTA synthase family protein [Anaerovoracaceae bacterium]|jgi:phosphoglycerol transferase MdoB-like AlkP superfamily enzyme